MEVASLKTENARFFANPSGSMTMEQSVVATRLKRDGEWVDIDPSLVSREDGSFGTRATAAEVVFSGGGAQEFARMTVGGAEIALRWPTPLPAPVVSGDIALYPEVLPGVDLRARAGREGFGHELVVKTREAATALTGVSFGLTTKGVQLSEDKGALKAVDSKGETVFSAPAATMWDSGGRTAAVGVAVDAAELALTPDRTLLTDPAATLPITIDPQYSYYEPRQAEWSVVRSGWADNAYHNPAPANDDERLKGVARVGKCPDCGRADTARSLFRFDAVPLQGTKINSARFFIKQGWKNQHTCDSNLVPYVDLHVLSHVGSDTTWNNQPAWSDANRVDSARPMGKAGYCNADWASFVIWAPAQNGADENWRNLVFGLKARDESHENGWRRFFIARENDGTESYPYISVEYNHHPDNARHPRTEPAASNRALGEAIGDALAPVGDTLALSMCLNPVMGPWCARPPGTTMKACGTVGASAVVGVSAEGCVVMDDKGVGIVYVAKGGLDLKVGVSTGAGYKVMRGDIEKQQDHPGQYAEVPFGRGELELATSGGKLHSVGLYGGAHARAQVPGLNHHLASGGAEYSDAVRIIDMPNLCRYCQAFKEGVAGWFK
ncbi:hypothetical protein SUDANB95_01900 [Actinosynnema sp. ALI-1.44]